MANIKISELNALSKKAYDDIVPIVDVSANETKKVSIEELINNNVDLLAVTDTAPSECSTGDKYYNTTTNKIYTATGTDTWGTTGEDAIEGIFYLVFEDQKSYAYDGTTLVSVGGGAGGGAYIGTEEPTDENVNFWINPDEVTNTQQQEELYSTSEIRIGTWVDGKPLYRTVVNFGALPNSSAKNAVFATTDKNITKIYGIARSSTNNLPLPFVVQDAPTNSIGINCGNGNIWVQTGSDRSSYSAYIIIEYTKTTD